MKLVPENKALEPIVDEDEIFTLQPSFADKLISRITGMSKKDFKNYFFNDVIMPSARDLAMDVFEGLLWGPSGRASRNRFGIPTSNRRGTTYTAFFGNGQTNQFAAKKKVYPGYDDVNEPDIIDNDNYTAVAFRSWKKAEEVLMNMRDRVEANGYVTIGDFNDLTRRKGEFVDYNYGWRSLEDAHVARVGGGAFVIRFPKPTSIR